MKCSRETIQKLQYFTYKKTHVFFFVFHSSNIENFETFCWNILLTRNLLFMKNGLTYMLRCMVCLFSYKLRARQTTANEENLSHNSHKKSPKVSFFWDPSENMSSSSFPPNKNRPLVGRPDRLANQKPVFLAGNCSNSCSYSDLLTRLTRKILTTRGNLFIFCTYVFHCRVRTHPLTTSQKLKYLNKQYKKCWKETPMAMMWCWNWCQKHLKFLNKYPTTQLICVFIIYIINLPR